MNSKTPPLCRWPTACAMAWKRRRFSPASASSRLIGLAASSALGGFVGRHGFYRVRGIMNRARENLRAAFPEKTDEEIEAVVREMCDNLGRTVAEYAHLGKFSVAGPRPRLEVVNLEAARAAMDEGKGVMFFSGHFANWEMMPFVRRATRLRGRRGLPAAEQSDHRPLAGGAARRQRA
ncbi:MAG: hypothetical protein WDN08_01350 [Rhizomicrobium sp.]